MLRICSKCKKHLDETSFNWKIKKVQLAYHCKQCSREYIRLHYQKNHQYYINKALKRNQLLRQQAHNFLGPYLLNHPCVDCGEKNILVLEFDHRDPKVKRAEISHIIQLATNLSVLKKEIAKCDVRCANCHRIKTALENSSWKVNFVSTHSSTG